MYVRNRILYVYELNVTEYAGTSHFQFYFVFSLFLNRCAT